MSVFDKFIFKSDSCIVRTYNKKIPYITKHFITSLKVKSILQSVRTEMCSVTFFYLSVVFFYDSVV